MKRLARWWWSLESSPWYINRLLFICGVVPLIVVGIAYQSVRFEWYDIRLAIRDTLKGPARS